MENTVAFDTLMQLISVVGSFITSPLWFGLSVLNILVISFLFTYVIGILLGSISPRILMSREKVTSSEIVDNIKSNTNSFDEKLYAEYLRAGGKPF